MTRKAERAMLVRMKSWAFGIFSGSPIQTLGINYRPTTPPHPGRLTQTPKDRPGKVLRLPRTCGVCGSYMLGYDALNVVTCGSCDALLSVSGQWHRHHGQIQPLTEADKARARRFAL
jgi:hypothetical protein